MYISIVVLDVIIFASLGTIKEEIDFIVMALSEEDDDN